MKRFLVLISILAIGLAACDKDDETISGNDVDGEAPTVQLTSPANGLTFSQGNTITLAAEANDNVGVERVDFMDDGKILGYDMIRPYEMSWVITKITDTGLHVITARAIDAAENSTTSSPVSIKITN